MILGIPVVDRHDLTNVCLDHIFGQRLLESTRPVIIDNASDVPYEPEEYGPKTDVINLGENTGYYYPLKLLYDAYPNEQYIGLMHNDLMLYETGFDRRMIDAFEADDALGLIGLCGSKEVDALGGRGSYTVCNFQGREVEVGGETWKGQDPSAGRPIAGIEPALVMDSLFMLFRRDVIPQLVQPDEKWEDLPLAHFYDRIWPIRTYEAGYHAVTMGSNCDHIGGMTTTGSERFRNDCISWLEDRGISYENPETEMYLEAERRYLNEYKHEKRWLPAVIRDGGFDVTHTAV